MTELWDIYQNFSTVQWVTLIVAAVLVGINKTGIPGIGTLPVVLLTLTFEARLSTGMQLIMLCFGDVMAVSYYRSKADKKLLVKLFPCALLGIAIGAVVLRFLSDDDLRKIIGGIILSLTVLKVAKDLFLNADALPRRWFVAVPFGVLGGFTTQVANAAGPVMALYLLTMKLPKEIYIGTSAWLFLTINYVKLPIFIAEGRITRRAFFTDLPMLPFIAVGAVLGVLFVRKMPQKLFEAVVEIAVAAAALYLLIK